MKAMLIDPFARTVSKVETDGSLASIYRLMDCDCIEPIRPHDANGDYLLLDENGKHRRNQKFFVCTLWPHDVLAGRALWIGSDGAEFTDARTDRDFIAANIEFEWGIDGECNDR